MHHSAAIVRAQAQDADVLTAIAFSAKRHWGYPETWIDAWRPTLTIAPEFIRENPTYLAAVEGRPCGFVAWISELPVAILEHLWVRPDVMRRGVGRALFEYAAVDARAAGAEVLRVVADPNAQAFYERMGAVRVGLERADVVGERRALPVLEKRLAP